MVERTRDAKNGDFASNIALALAKRAGEPPRELAKRIIAAIPASDIVTDMQIAGPGFINFFIAADAWRSLVPEIVAAGDAYGRSEAGGGRTVLIEFVSANPTGPLHIGHGRNAAFGSSLASVMSAAGFEVTREYYVNDAGRQADIFALSVWLRYLETGGATVPFPAKGYPGDYIARVAGAIREAEGDRYMRDVTGLGDGLPGDDAADAQLDQLIERARASLGPDYRVLLDAAIARQLDEIRARWLRCVVVGTPSASW